MRFLLARVSLRWQLATTYVLCLSAALGLLGLVLYAEVRNIVETSVYDQLQADASRVFTAGPLQAVAPTTTGWRAYFPPHLIARGAAPFLPPSQAADPACAAAPPAPSCPTSAGASNAGASAPTANGPATGDPSGGSPVAADTPATGSAPAAAPDLGLDRLLPRDVAMRYVDASGRTVSQAGSATLLNELAVPAGWYAASIVGSGQTIRRDQGAPPYHLAVLLAPAVMPDGSRGVLEAAAPLSSVDGFLAIFRISLLAGGAIALGSGTILGLALTRRLLRPLDRMAGVSWTVASGDLARRFTGPPGSREVTTLARNFNHMIDRLEASLRSQQRFTADAAHELRTPLTALGGNVELLLMGADEGDPQRVQKSLRSMDLEIQRLTRLVNDLLQISRMEGRGNLQAAPVDVAALVADVAAELRLVGPHAVVEAQTDGPLVVNGDRDRLKQVLLNIGDNALKFTPPGGAVTLSAVRMGGLARLRVSDSGPGIPPADLPRIFDRFYRSDESRTRASGGMGLGLAIAKAIVDAHRGAISASSTLGRGATFTIDLPLAPGAISPPPLSAPRTAGVEATNGKVSRGRRG